MIVPIKTDEVSQIEFVFFFSSVGRKMSLCCAADGHILVHRGSTAGGHCDAPGLPFSDTGNSFVQESVPSVLS